ncbi:MAG TPA: hypothetical protein DDY21_02720 [Candidatus Moranbacteria bacterium]|nr:hypothetical protein [Candidatus Moranbacteria bacterium]HCO99350.1 hypothetical protein [Candidatus Moranbacteria bacterium]
MLKQELAAIGLSESEAGAYLALLELGEASISQIAQKAGVKRPTTYLIIESLKNSGLVSMSKKRKKTLFVAEDPRKIIDILDERKKKMDRIMPELLSFANLLDQKPAIRFFEGDEGIKNVYRDTVSHHYEEMLTFFSKSFADFDEAFFWDVFTPKRIENRIWARAIVPNQELIQKLVLHDEEHKRETKIVQDEAFIIDIEINLYDQNKIAIISFDEKFALIIESEKIHNSLKNIFNLIWRMLPENELKTANKLSRPQKATEEDIYY